MKKSILNVILAAGISTTAVAQYSFVFTENFTEGFDGSLLSVTTTPDSNFAQEIDNPGPEPVDPSNDYVSFNTQGLNPNSAEAPGPDVAGVPTGASSIFLTYTGSGPGVPATPTNSTDWAASVDTSNFSSSSGFPLVTSSSSAVSDEFVNIGLSIGGGGNSFGWSNNAYYVDDPGGLGQFASSDAIFSYNGGFAQPLDFDGFSIVPAKSFLVEFTELNQTFTLSYASSVTGSLFTPYATLRIDGVGTSSGTDIVEDWGMAEGDEFDVSLFASSNLIIGDFGLGLGYINADNFSIGSNVPEPSSYAMIAGALALAFTAVRRRK